MQNGSKHWVLLGLLILCTGCVDGPFYSLKRANPYYRAQWRKDKALGPTYEERIAELELLKLQIASMDAAKQAEWARQLEGIITKDSSPEMRYRAVSVIANVQSDATVRALNTASADDSEKVRLAACKAWKSYRGPAARDMLLSLAQKEGETTSVRQSAIESLGAFDEPEVRNTLGNLLADSSPAVQYQVTQSLSRMTGKDYGGDFELWKQYLAGQNVPQPESESTATRVWNALPSIR